MSRSLSYNVRMNDSFNENNTHARLTVTNVLLGILELEKERHKLKTGGLFKIKLGRRGIKEFLFRLV